MRSQAGAGTSRSPEQLAFVFEEVVRETRSLAQRREPAAIVIKDELRTCASDFAKGSRARRLPPETMLVELKTLLKQRARGGTSPERDALVSEVTEWAISAYYEAR